MGWHTTSSKRRTINLYWKYFKKIFNVNMNVSEYIVKYLEEKKIKNVFLVTGGGMMFMVNALSKSKIRLLHNHH